MNHTSGSALQKVSFVLVLFIAAAAGYLVVRERLRADQQREAALAASAATANPSPASAVPERAASSTEKPGYAPLRARVETNVVRVPSNRFIALSNPASATPRVVLVGESQPYPRNVAQPGPANSSPVLVVAGGGVRGGGSSVSGRVLLRGTPPPEKAVVPDATCGRLHPAPMTTRHYVVGTDDGLADVLVYVKQGAEPQPVAQVPAPPLLDQVNCEYTPYVIGLQVGQVLKVRNSDSVMHNVHPITKFPSGRIRNVAQPVKGITHEFVFEKPEIFVQFKCDVHPWMFAYVGVVEHPWFAVTDQQGNFALPPGLPPGRYTLSAVHRKAGEQTQSITVSADRTVPVTFTFEVPAP